MANGLLLVLELIEASPKTDTAKALIKAFAPPKPVNVLHYAYAVPLDLGDNKPRLLLSTIYDEKFEAYIADIVNALPEAFDQAAAGIVGMKDLIPIAKNIPAFTKFILENDMTKGGTAYVNGQGGFFSAYPWTVNQIKAHMPTSPPKAAAKAKKQA